MCTQYVPTARDEFHALRLGVAQLPHGEWPPEVFPGYQAPILVRANAWHAANDGPTQTHFAVSGGVVADTLASSTPVCELAQFGLVPRWSRDAAQAQNIAKGAYNARSETVAGKPSFRTPWRAQHWALVPMQQYYDPNWEDAAHNGGRCTRWRVAMASGESFTCAGLWERWHDPATQTTIGSFTLLTVNADGHPLSGRLHRPGDEKRMPVVIAAYDRLAWLNASPAQASLLLRTTPADLLVGGPAPVPLRKAPAAALAELTNGARHTAGKTALATTALQQNYSLF